MCCSARLLDADRHDNSLKLKMSAGVNSTRRMTHDCRHSFASRALALGESLPTIRQTARSQPHPDDRSICAPGARLGARVGAARVGVGRGQPLSRLSRPRGSGLRSGTTHSSDCEISRASPVVANENHRRQIRGLKAGRASAGNRARPKTATSCGRRPACSGGAFRRGRVFKPTRFEGKLQRSPVRRVADAYQSPSQAVIAPGVGQADGDLGRRGEAVSEGPEAVTEARLQPPVPKAVARFAGCQPRRCPAREQAVGSALRQGRPTFGSG